MSELKETQKILLKAIGPSITKRRKSRIANAAFFFISGFGYAAWASRIPTIRTELHLSDSMLGTLLLAMPVGLLCTLPLTNYLLGKFSSRSIMLFGSLFFNSVLLITGFVSAIWQLFIMLFCFGSSRNLLNISMNAQAVSVQRQYKKKSVITAFHGVWSIAGFLGAALGYLMVSFDIGTAWHFPAVGLAMMGITFWQYRHTVYEPPEANKRKTLFAWPDKAILNYAFIVFICMACENTMYDWSGVYFQKTMHAAPAVATAAFASYMVMMTVGRFAGDHIVNKVGIKTVLSYCSLLLTVGFLIPVLFPFPVAGFFGFMMAGLGVSCIAPLVFSLAGQSANQSSATAMASISSISYFGFLLVPPLIGFLSEAIGIRISFGIITAMAALMIYLISRIKKDAEQVKEHPQEALV
jgi:MFS family permease